MNYELYWDLRYREHTEEKTLKESIHYLAIMTPETPVSCLCRSTSSNERISPFPAVDGEEYQNDIRG